MTPLKMLFHELNLEKKQDLVNNNVELSVQ